jgi:flagellar biosynthesis protein FlhA
MSTLDSRLAGLAATTRRHSDWLLGLGALGLVATLVVPVPAPVLDLLIALNLATSLLLILVVTSTRSAAELSTFPTLLLLATLFRLGLNVASTRQILSGGDAGRIIRAFGTYVCGDNLTVGLVVFLILVVIQFVVITKGAGRISEVAARFVLDAMPGKQMAIDADLSSGMIDADEARARRARIASEAEFYGAMDGASKFVRGDAIAGLIITALNLVGGIAIATLKGMPLAAAGERYSTLTIGDGLVTQIPALLVSTAAGVLVTKATSATSLSAQMLGQVGGRPRATLITASILFALGLVPGLPGLPFFALAFILLAGWRASRKAAGAGDAGESDEPARGAKAAAEARGGDADGEAALALTQVDRIAVEIGYRLIPLVEDGRGSGILDHVAQLRRRLAQRDGFVLPPVRIVDNVRLGPCEYRVLLSGLEVARGEVEPGQFLALDDGAASGKIAGRAARDPAFGLPALWIRDAARAEAEALGYTVIHPVAVIATHLGEVLRTSLAEILTRDDVKRLVETARGVAPAVVEELVPDKLGYGEIQAVLKNLLREGVGIKNLPAVLEVLADNVAKTKDADALSELVRQRLGRALCEAHADEHGKLRAVTLDPRLEQRLTGAAGAGHDSELTPAYLQRVVEKIGESVAAATKSGADVVVLARSNVRRFLSELVRASLPKVAVLSYNEVVSARSVETLTVVRVEE